MYRLMAFGKMNPMKKVLVIAIIFIAALLITYWITQKAEPAPAGANWSEYLGGPDRNHYSELAQVDTSNVNRLTLAWAYTTPDSGQMQANPIIVDGVLYSVSSK